MMLIKRIALLVMIFVMSLSAPALAAEPGSGMIEGQIVNGTAGGSSVADQDITLETYLNNAEVGSTATKADAEGQFVFDGLSTEAGYIYRVLLTFQEAEYYSEWVGFGEEEIVKSVEVTVYDSTTSDEAIKVVTAHTIIYVGQGSLQVNEYYLFVNEADRTFVGLEEVTADGKKETLRFPLPDETTELQVTLGLMECCILDSEGGFIDTMAVLPGSKEVAYSYNVDYSSGVYTFSQRINYPISGYDFLIQGEGVEIATDQLTIGEPMDIGGVLFSYLSGRDFTPGDTLVVRISGLPKTSNNRGVILGVILALVVLGAGFGFVYLTRKGKSKPVSPELNLDQRRQKLLVELVQLDDDFEAGKIQEGNYLRLRSVKKAQLVEVIQKLRGE